MKTLIFIVFAVTHSAHAQFKNASLETNLNTCRAVDLRQSDLNRPQSQVFMDVDGMEADTNFCGYFSSALLISQQVGISVSQIDYTFQIIVNGRSDQKPLGFCGQKAVDAYRGRNSQDFVQAFADFVHQLNPNAKIDPNGLFEMNKSEKQKIGQWLDKVCGERIPMPTFKTTTIGLKTEGLLQVVDELMSATEIGEEIDRLLDKGQFVSYGHGFHLVTIAGRTEDCRYIIQDSIPESAWNKFGGLKVSLSAPEDEADITFENQFFQYWPRTILLKNVKRIEYAQTTGR
jgi:hypothetical protein